jgi:ribonuclease P protein component
LRDTVRNSPTTFRRIISLKTFPFPKKDRILKRYEFLEFYVLGKAVHSPGFILVYKIGKSGRSRIGITVSRKVGHAVARNRIKRHIREYYRLHRMAMPKPWDFHVIAKKSAAFLSFQDTAAMLAGLFDKFKKIAERAPVPMPAILP